MEKILIIIKSFLRKYPVYIWSTIFFMILIPINDVYMSKLYGKLFESIQNNTFTMNQFAYILLIMSLIQIGYGIMDIIDSKQVPLFQQHCKELFIRNIFDRYKDNYKELLTGDLLSKILRSQHIITAWYSRISTYIIPHIFEFTFTALYFFWIDWVLGLSFVTLLGVFTFALILSPAKSNDTTTKSDKSLNNLHEEIDDLLSNYLTVYKEQKLDYELKRLKEYSNIFIKNYNIAIRNTMKYRILLIVILIVFLFTFIYRCFTLLKNKSMKKALFYSLVMMITHLIGNLIWMIDTVRDVMFDYGTIKNSEFLSESKPKQKQTLCKDFDNKDIILKVHDVYYKYPIQKSWVLNKINLDIREGERIGILGPIGSGKSTLLKIMLRLIKPTKGQLYLHGMCYSKMNTKTFYKHIGFMPQNCVLFNRSILENIKYDNTNVSEKEIMDVIDRFGLMRHFSNLEKGIHSPAGKNGMNLSGGQRQLVWFLKLFLKKPSIIIMDEPTASLDKKTKDLFIEIMDTLLKDKTIIIVTHDDYLMKYIDTSYRIMDGELVLIK